MKRHPWSGSFVNDFKIKINHLQSKQQQIREIISKNYFLCNFLFNFIDSKQKKNKMQHKHFYVVTLVLVN